MRFRSYGASRACHAVVIVFVLQLQTPECSQGFRVFDERLIKTRASRRFRVGVWMVLNMVIHEQEDMLIAVAELCRGWH